jgi:clan AA aspartic protease
LGTVTVTIQVGDHQGHQFETIDIVVDTGSTYTAVPRAMLQRLGVPVQRSLPSETADGRMVPVDVGETIIRLEGLQFHTPVIFAEENEPSLLGVVTLEEASLAVDPVGGRLIPTHLLRY